MTIDTPAKLAILGAGPIGLEAALYARFLGYDVTVLEGGEVAESVRRWGHVRMFTPFGMNRSPLGVAAIQAQEPSWQPPPDDSLLTGREWVERYLLPLSQTDLLTEHIHPQNRVLAIGKEELLKQDMPGHPDRGDWSFRILVQNAAGQERIELVDGVLDCMGVFAQGNRWLGHGGIPAIGEIGTEDLIEKRLPDILGADRAHYAGKETLLVGAGYSAATNVIALSQLARSDPGTRVIWITRREGPAGSRGPVAEIANDRLPYRAEVAREANRLAGDPSTGVTWWPATVVERINAKLQADEVQSFEVELSGRHAGNLRVDRIIANVGFRPWPRFHEELQIHECYATEGPMKLAAALGGKPSADCLDQAAVGPQMLVNPEPNYYILGAKSYGRRSDFLFAAGLEQIRQAFTIIGDRETLDLYQGATRLIP
jgi:thioredoxin reductase